MRPGRHPGSEISRAVQFVERELRAEFRLLLCGPEVARVYARNGWRPVDGPTVIEQPAGKRTSLKVTMGFGFGRERWPSGPIDLCGLPW